MLGERWYKPFHNRRLGTKVGNRGTVSPWSMDEKLQQKLQRILHTLLVISMRRKNGEKWDVIKVDNGRKQERVGAEKWEKNGVKEGVSGQGKNGVELDKFGHFFKAG